MISYQLKIMSMFIFNLLVVFYSHAHERPYHREEPPREAKYLYVTVRNCSTENPFTINSVTMGGGDAYDIPRAGVRIPPRETAAFVFKQVDFPLFRGPEATIEINGRGGIFYLYAQQNYCLLESGKITANYNYQSDFSNIEGGCQINGILSPIGSDVHTVEGAFDRSFGKVSFQLQERRRGDQNRAPDDWRF